MARARPRITITKNGPYRVEGSVPLRLETIGVNDDGESVRWVEGHRFETKEEPYNLCRCGSSRNKPFCDGTHQKTRFDGTETATRATVLQQAQVMEGPEMALADAEGLCAFARFCDPNGRIWNQVAHTDDPKVRANFVRQAGDCPAGRLIALEKATASAVEPKLTQSIGVIEDPERDCSGALWVRGGVELVGANGTSYEVRNRMTLCRCGRSENKPFCNGSHAAEPTFKDGLQEPPPARS